MGKHVRISLDYLSSESFYLVDSFYDFCLFFFEATLGCTQGLFLADWGPGRVSGFATDMESAIPAVLSLQAHQYGAFLM